MVDEPTKGRLGIDRDLDMIFAETEALRELASDPDKAQDGARVYDLSIRWGTLMSGRLKRLEYYYRTGDLTEDQERRYRRLRDELKDAIPLIERLGIGRPTVPLEESANGMREAGKRKLAVNKGIGEPGVKKGQF